MTSADSIIDQIDGALYDCSVGPDAMRYAPGGAQSGERVITITADQAAALQARFREVGTSINLALAAFGPAAANAAQGLAAFTQAFQEARQAEHRPA
ncbi:hypothetical protein ABIE67_007887 [Streptomyces sp. V4I8]|uniref:hypothetical protein n=1 Tax=Streptomyces sp. V4I8 TaxID=3156469 RepID=UPI0035176785